MALSDNQLAPSPPNVFAAYRAFYILPSDTLSSSVVGVDFFVARSSEDLTWNQEQYLGRGDNIVGLYWTHTGLDEATYYAYWVQYIYSDGSKSPIGQVAYPGQAQLIISPTLNIDQLASKAYSTGLVTAGTFRGVVFETSLLDPKVRMDPTGLFATDTNHVQTFYLNAYTGAATFSGNITGGSISIPPNFSVTSSGVMSCASATVSGTVNASGGTFSGSIAVTGTLSGGTISAGTIEDNSGRILIDSAGDSIFPQFPGAIGAGQPQDRGKFVSWGAVTTGSLTKPDSGSGDWVTVSTGTGATQIALGANFCSTICCFGGSRETGNHSFSVQASNGINPWFTSWVDGVLQGGWVVEFVAFHD